MMTEEQIKRELRNRWKCEKEIIQQIIAANKITEHRPILVHKLRLLSQNNNPT